jgi:iron complex outermembrane recepter protein
MAFKNRRAKLLISAACAYPMMLGLAVAPAAAQTSPPATAQPPEAADIVVTGIRASLEESIALKRGANQIVDTITAEDIGKLPDQNIAESIQRVTGVQITRNGGEGVGVNIRGLTALTTINGRVGIGTGSRTFYLSSRDYDYRNLAAEFFQSIEVFKSPLASQPEGALGGTVNLVTRKPLDFSKPVVSLGIEGQYGDFAQRLDPRASFFVTDKFLDDTLGFALSATYSKRHLRGDYFQALGGWQRSTLGTNTGFDFNPADAAVNQDVIRPVDLRLRTQDSVRSRYGVDGTIQWQPSSEFQLRLDGTYSRFVNEYRNAFFRTLFTNPTSFVPGSLNIDSRGSLQGATFTNQSVQVDGRYESEPIDSYTFGGNAKWEKGKLSLIVDASASQTKYKLLSQFLRYQGSNLATVAYGFRGTNTPPTIALTNANGTPYDLTSPNQYIVNLAQDRLIASTGREYALRGDLKYKAEAGALESISGGVRATWRDSSFRVKTSANQAGNAANPSFFNQTSGARLTAADAPLNQFIGVFPWSGGIFPSEGGTLPRSWLVSTYGPTDPETGSASYLSVLRIRDFGGQLNSNPEQSDISENTVAAYISSDWSGAFGSLEFKGNAGLRYVSTKTVSSGVFVNGAGALTPVTVSNDYGTWLPAANLTLNLRQDLLLRFAGARVLQRPDLDQLATGYNLNLSSGVATVGNPLLKPFQADQFDVSLEFYPTRGTLISAAVFYKKVKNFVATQTFTGTIPGVTRLDGGTSFQITQPINGGGGEIKGFELGVQLPLTFLPKGLDGLGIIANYTYSDSKTDSGQPIPRLSKQSVNVIGYYEKGGFSSRVAYSWRSAFAENGEGGNASQVLGLYEYIAPAGYLDASVSYDITPNVTLTVDGANLLKTKEIRYSGIESRLRDLQVTDRRFTFGVRARF